MSSKSPAPRRRPGAPRGNTNALKHGFYAKKLHPADLADIENHRFDGLSEEILALRVIIRQLLEAFNHCVTPDQTFAYGRVLVQAFASLSRLMRTEKVLGYSQDSLLQIALSELHDELGIEIDDCD